MDINGNLRNSKGDTTNAGASDKAFVIQKWAISPQKPIIVIQINSKPLGKSISPSTPAQISPKENCIRVSQNKMQVIVSVLVSSLVAIEVTAKPIAHKAAEIIAGSKAEKLGLATINIPTKPIAIDKNLEMQ